MKYLLFVLGLLWGASSASANPPLVREDAADAAIIAANNELAVALYHAAPGKETLCFSPLGLTTLLSLLLEGAKSDTAVEIEKLLNVDLPRDQALPAAFSVDKALSTVAIGESYLFNIRTGLWIDRKAHINDDFKTRIGEAAEMHSVDFAAKVETAKAIEQDVNDPVGSSLVAALSIEDGAKVFLTEAVQLSDSWLNPFDKALTEKALFHGTEAQETDVSLMHQKAKFRYLRAARFQALEIPYRSHDLSLIILLPDQADDLPTLEKNMTYPHLNRWIHELRFGRKVDVALPKIKLAQSFAAKETLRQTGMKLAFLPEAADFSGMSSQTSLHISAILQNASFDINEAGVGDGLSEPNPVAEKEIGPSQTIIFRADHPFVFLVQDDHSGAFLYMGRVSSLAGSAQSQ